MGLGRFNEKTDAIGLGYCPTNLLKPYTVKGYCLLFYGLIRYSNKQTQKGQAMYPTTQKEIIELVKQNGGVLAHLKSWASVRGLSKLGYTATKSTIGDNLYFVSKK